MEIEYKEFAGSKAKVNSLSDIVKSKAYDYDSGAVESANARAKVAIEFTEKVVELLYTKGLFNDKDIATLVAGINFCDEDDVKVVK
jgi:hypothetical protein